MYRKKSGDLSSNWWDYGQAHDLKKHMILALLIFFEYSILAIYTLPPKKRADKEKKLAYAINHGCCKH
jgi:hypothetical protein